MSHHGHKGRSHNPAPAVAVTTIEQTCSASTKAGEPCKRIATKRVDELPYCSQHAPEENSDG